MNPLEGAKCSLIKITNDPDLIESLFESYSTIASAYLTGKTKQVLQNVGLFVESMMRVVEHVVLGNHTAIKAKFDLDAMIQNLEKTSGHDRLRIIVARQSRVLYDFRTRMKSVHLKSINPEQIDAHLIYNVCSWILVDILQECDLSDAEAFIVLAASRKTVLVSEVDGILRTTEPMLKGPQRIILILYSAPSPVTEDDLYSATKTVHKSMGHLRTNLRNLEKVDCVHNLGTKGWQLFGKGFNEAERLILKYSR